MLKFKNPGEIADAYADLKARQKELADYEAELKAAAIATGQPVLNGKKARLTISLIAGNYVSDTGACVAWLQDHNIDVPVKWRSETYRFQAKQQIADASLKQ